MYLDLKPPIRFHHAPIFVWSQTPANAPRLIDPIPPKFHSHRKKIRESTSKRRPPKITNSKIPSRIGETGDLNSLSFFFIADSGLPILAVFCFANLRLAFRCSGVCAIFNSYGGFATRGWFELDRKYLRIQLPKDVEIRLEGSQGCRERITSRNLSCY